LDCFSLNRSRRHNAIFGTVCPTKHISLVAEWFSQWLRFAKRLETASKT
jgi:hypothetical protein